MNNHKLFRLLRTVALISAISLFAALTFEAFHTGHEEACHEEDCPICLVLQIIHSTEKIGQNAVLTSVEFTNIFFINVIILSALLLAPATLVKQKVKLVI
jgi:hypothetical protein